jgi:hypothetical protein
MSSVDSTPIGLADRRSITTRCEASWSTISSAACASSSLLAAATGRRHRGGH